MNSSNCLNLGMMAGFARMDGDTLRVFQSQYEAHGFSLRLASGARRAEFDYEPVAVAYRITGGVNGVPEFEAVEVSRMARSQFPRNNAGGWFRTKVYAENGPDIEAAMQRLSFRPFGTDAGLYDPNPDVLELLVDKCQWSEALLETISGEDLLEDAFFAPQGTASRFPNQWVGAGCLLEGEFTKGRNRDDTQTYNFVWARFGLGLVPRPSEDIVVVIASAVPGFSRLRQLTIDRQIVPVVLTARVHFSGKKVPDGKASRLEFAVKELLIPTQEDYGLSPAFSQETGHG